MNSNLPKRTEHDRAASWCLIFMVIIAVLIYFNSFRGVFLFDDNGRIVGNDALKKFFPVSEHLNTSRPIVTLSLAMNYAFGGLEPWGYHLFNLTVHLIAGLALFGVVRRTLVLHPSPDASSRSSHWLAFAVALLWLIHPLQTQSVTYIIQRAESMMGMFYLLTLYCVIRGATAGQRNRLWYVTAVIASACGMGSKAVMITAPFMIFLYDRIFLEDSVAAVMRRRWLLYIGLIACWTILFTHGVAGRMLIPGSTSGATVGFELQGTSSLEYVLTQSQVILHYLRLSFWPDGQVLDYGWPIVRTFHDAVVPGTIVMILIAGVLFAFFKKPWLGFLGAWFFVILSPTSSFVPIKDPIYEHRMYLSLAAVVTLTAIGGHWIVAWCLRRLSIRTSHQRFAWTCLLIVLAASLGYSTMRRNRLYHSRYEMWNDVVSKRPDNARAHTNLGLAIFKRGEVDEAVRCYRRALELEPDHREARRNIEAVKNRFYNRALDLSKAGQKTEALNLYREAQQIIPEDIKVNINLANILVDLGQHDEAAVELQRALEKAQPNTHPTLIARARFNLGNILARQAKSTEAIEQYRLAIRADQNYYNAYYGLGLALEQRGRVDEAIKAYRSALAIKPSHASARTALDAALSRNVNTGDQ